MLNEKMIKKFEDAGFKRWTKGGYDRLYIDATACGLEYDTYKSGNISSATFNGEAISNARAGRMKAMKMYVDIATGEFHAEHAYGTKGDAEIAAAAEAIYTAIVEAAEAEEKAEEAEEDAAKAEQTEVKPANGFGYKKKLVESGRSRIYENWAKYQGITKEDFIAELEWLCKDERNAEGRLTRELGCRYGKLHRLFRSYGGGLTAFRNMDGTLWNNCGAASISAADSI